MMNLKKSLHYLLFLCLSMVSVCALPSTMTYYLKTHLINQMKLQQKVKSRLFHCIHYYNFSDVRKILKRVQPRHLNFSDIYPVHSKLLSPGVVSARAIANQVGRPIFLVGSDALSQRWLRRHVKQLKGLNAIGFVVNVETASKFDLLQSLVPALPLHPMCADVLAAHFSLQHYPVLISDRGVEQ